MSSGLSRWFWYLLPANPLVVRIVEGGSRRQRHLWVRMGYLGVLVLLVVIGLLSGGGVAGAVSLNELAKVGTWIFAIVAYGQVILVCLLAPLFMAGAIAQEQSGRTMDILLTTPLSNLQIVLGSLLGRLFFVLTLLLSGLPLFSVLLVFGGVPIASVFTAFLIAGITALVMGSIAIALAVLRKGGRKAVFVFVIITGAYLVAVYAADRMVRYMQTSGGATAGAAGGSAPGAAGMPLGGLSVGSGAAGEVSDVVAPSDAASGNGAGNAVASGGATSGGGTSSGGR